LKPWSENMGIEQTNRTVISEYYNAVEAQCITSLQTPNSHTIIRHFAIDLKSRTDERCWTFRR